MLLPLLIHRKPLKVNIPPGPELRLHRPGDVDGALHVQLRDAALHDGELQRDAAGHLNGAAERNLAVALAEVQIADAELGAGDVDGQVDARAARQVFDVAVAAVFGAAGDGAVPVNYITFT